MISNSFQKLNKPAYFFDFNVYKQANVNTVIRSWQHYRRFLGAISFLYHARIQEIFVGFGGGEGGPSPTD